MKFHNKIIAFFLLFTFNTFVYAQLFDIPSENWLSVKQKLIEAGETDKLIELEIWFDIEENHQNARQAYNEKIQACWDIARNNKPPIADLLQLQFDQQYIQDNRENIGRVLAHLNFKLGNECSKQERDEFIRTEMLYFSNMERYLYNITTLIKEDYFDKELIDQVSLTLKEASSQLELDEAITLENIKEYYLEMPFSITDTYMVLSYETHYELYKRRAQMAPVDIQEFLANALTEPVDRIHQSDEIYKLFPEVYRNEAQQ